VNQNVQLYQKRMCLIWCLRQVFGGTLIVNILEYQTIQK